MFLHRHLLNEEQLSILVSLLLPSIWQIWNTRKIDSCMCSGMKPSQAPRSRRRVILLISCTLNSLDQLPRVTRFKGGGYRRPSIPSGMYISASDLAKILLHSWPPFSVHSVPPLPASLSSCSCEREFPKTATTSAGTADTEQRGADLCHGLKRPITSVYQLACLQLDPKPIEAKQLQRLLFLFNTFIPRIVYYLFGST